MKKGLVVSVGGSQGAYAGGILEYKLRKGSSYDSLYGSSVGSVVIPFASLNNMIPLKEAFTSITMDDVFELNPFNVTDINNGMFRYTLNYWNVFKTIFIKKKLSLGDTEPLRKNIIPKFFPEDEYLQILNLNKNLTVMVTNLTTGELEAKRFRDYSREEFMDWMWASTCAPPFMSVPEINGQHYTDGGILSQVPIKQAILDGCDEIDIIILSKENHDWPIEKIRNFFHYQIKLLLLMMNRIKDHQVDVGYLSSLANKKVILNFHYTKRRLTNNSLIFDPNMMNKWWKEGYDDAEKHPPISYIINGKKDSFRKIN